MTPLDRVVRAAEERRRARGRTLHGAVAGTLLRGAVWVLARVPEWVPGNGALADLFWATEGLARRVDPTEADDFFEVLLSDREACRFVSQSMGSGPPEAADRR